MKVLVLIASLFLAQVDTASTAAVAGRITMDDSSPLPLVTTFRGPAVMFALLAFVPWSSSRVAEAAINTDGSFQLPLSVVAGRGRFTVVATRMPLGYYVKSMTHGSADLLQSPLSITPESVSTPVQVVLSKVPPAGTSGGVTVSGRIGNWTPNAFPLPLSLQSSQPDKNGVQVLRLSTLEGIKPDGTFEISAVPSGTYRAFTPDSSDDLLRFDVGAHDVRGLEIPLPYAGVPSIIVTSIPFAPLGGRVLSSPPNLAPSATSLRPPSGSAIVSIAQSGSLSGLGWRHGAWHFFRIERSGEILEERKLEANIPLAFTLAPGTYDLRSYSRPCNTNCGYLGPPEVLCRSQLSVVADQVLYVERVLQASTCTIQFIAPPQ
jgi:hypothetical protein